MTSADLLNQHLLHQSPFLLVSACTTDFHFRIMINDTDDDNDQVESGGRKGRLKSGGMDQDVGMETIIVTFMIR